MRMSEEEYRAFMARRQTKGQAVAAMSREEHAAAHSITLPQDGETKRRKYGNQRAEIDGKKFDSKHEAAVYEALMYRVWAGELKTVVRQAAFDLPGGIRYVADFLAIDQDNRVTVYDAKSEITRKNRVYINKKKQMRACCGIEIVEV